MPLASKLMFTENDRFGLRGAGAALSSCITGERDGDADCVAVVDAVADTVADDDDVGDAVPVAVSDGDCVGVCDSDGDTVGG